MTIVKVVARRQAQPDHFEVQHVTWNANIDDIGTDTIGTVWLAGRENQPLDQPHGVTVTRHARACTTSNATPKSARSPTATPSEPTPRHGGFKDLTPRCHPYGEAATSYK